MSVDASEFVRKRRDRVLATILSFKENEIDQHLPKEKQQALRRVIMSNVNDFNDLVLDLIKALSEPVSVEWNQLYLEAMTRIDGRLDDLLRATLPDDAE